MSALSFLGGRFMLKVENNIRLARTLRRMSQYELARRTGLVQARLSLLENGYSSPKLVELKAMALALGVDDFSELWSQKRVEGD
jgi:transcriptional regulator with XRE-family HTH domain